MKKRRKKRRKKHAGGRPVGEVGKLAKKEGISRAAAWYRLNRATGRPAGRPRKKRKFKGTGGEGHPPTMRRRKREPFAVLEGMD